MTHARRYPRRTALVLAFTLLFAGCSAVGLELPNYGFYGFVPHPDGAMLKSLTMTERAEEITGNPPKPLGEATFQIDTVIVAGREAWLLTRSRSDANAVEQTDSIWLDRSTLKPIRTWGRRAEGEIRQAFDRRVVVTETTSPRGRRSKSRLLLDAEAYAEPGIELVMATIPLRENYDGALPLVLMSRVIELRWFRFRVVQKVFLPGRDGVLRSTWQIDGDLGGILRRYWIDADDRTVVKWEGPGPDGVMVRWVRGRPMPRLKSFDIERIGG